MIPSKLAVNRLLVMAPPKLEAVYSAKPLVDAGHVYKAPSLTPGFLKSPSTGLAIDNGTGGQSGVGLSSKCAVEGELLYQYNPAPCGFALMGLGCPP